MVKNPFQLQKRLKNCSKPKMFLDIVGGHYNIKVKHFDDFLVKEAFKNQHKYSKTSPGGLKDAILH